MKAKEIVFQWIILFMTLVLPYELLSQSPTYSDKSLNIKRTDEKMVVDGELNEFTWSDADIADNFVQNFPSDTSLAVSQTSFMVTYDDDNLYLGVTCFDFEKGPYNVNSLRRDFRGPDNDMIVFVLEPFLDKTNGFMFGITPFGSMKEAMIFNGGETNYAWDHKWFANAKRHDGYWTAELAIPFKTIRYNEGAENWTMNLYRIDTKQNERSSWSGIPRSFKLTSLTFTGNLVWDKPLDKPGSNVVLIPFVSSGVQKDFLNDKPSEKLFEIGGDVKVGITPSLNLDLTINPDFSQVEVDQQVTDLSRFEIFFEERRQFFIENADLFSSFGSETIRPFFSRRIGIGYDSVIKQNVQNPILAGAKLSGKIDNNWRVGLLSVQSAKNDEINLPSQNYSVAVIQRKLFSRSNISVMFVNKQPILTSKGDSVSLSTPDFNRVFGLEYNLATVGDKWTGKLFYHKSISKFHSGNNAVHGSWLQYKTRSLNAQWRHEFVDDEFNAEVGYIPRKGYYRLNPQIETNFYPKSRLINRHGPGVALDSYWDENGNLNERQIDLLYSSLFQNSAQLDITISHRHLTLRNDFDPTKTGGESLSAGSTYTYVDFKADFRSDKRKLFYYQFITQNGQYFNGNRISFSGNVNYRVPPRAVLSVEYSYNKINMPDPYLDADLLLVGPRIDLTFTKNLYFNTFIQYNNQIDNLNINSRFQWRFKPVSDLYIVYTDNYYPSNLKTKNRALVLKLTYWLNV